jgi:hypothetical protein
MDAPALNATVPDYLQVTSSLAVELASGLSPPSDVFDRYGISKEDAVLLLSDNVFKRMLKEAHAEWNAADNTPDRIRLKAQMALEELLAPTFMLAQDPRVPAVSRNDATKLFERLSGVAKQSDDSGGQGPKFVLTISVGKQEETREIEGEVISTGDYNDDE